ncbi:MAG: hypothetical protein ABR499_14180 [Gemmatimonadaceae bacterium]
MADAHELLNRVLALVRTNTPPGQATVGYILPDDVATLDREAARVFKVIGSARFIDTPPEKYGLLARDIATLLAVARDDGASPPVVGGRLRETAGESRAAGSLRADQPARDRVPPRAADRATDGVRAR